MTLRPDDPLLQGYRRFRKSVWPRHAERYARLTRRRQRPETAVVACSDARVDPQTIFDAEPGELFVVRNVAGLVPEYAPDGGCHGTSAALEYAVNDRVPLKRPASAAVRSVDYQLRSRRARNLRCSTSFATTPFGVGLLTGVSLLIDVGALKTGLHNRKRQHQRCQSHKPGQDE